MRQAFHVSHPPGVLVGLRVKKAIMAMRGLWSTRCRTRPNYTVGEPFVFAFEIVRANYVAEHLGPSANDVTLAPVPEDLFVR